MTLSEAEENYNECGALTVTTLSENEIKDKYVTAAKSDCDAAKMRMLWLRNVIQEIESGRSSVRSRLTTWPKWAFAGNLRELAAEVERIVSAEKIDKGTKDKLPFVYISNPPRHGKSLLLDTLFVSNDDVCVLNVTYSAATSNHEDEFSSPKGAMRGLLTRLISDLVFPQAPRWSHIWDHSPVSRATDMGEMVRIFESMLGIGNTGPQRKLLICIDEISKLTDNEANKWAKVKAEQVEFWKFVYSFTRATAS